MPTPEQAKELHRPIAEDALMDAYQFGWRDVVQCNGVICLRAGHDGITCADGECDLALGLFKVGNKI